MREEERPAYLYYRLRRDDNPEELSGKKQRFEETKVSLQGGEVVAHLRAGRHQSRTDGDGQQGLAVCHIDAAQVHKAGIPITGTPPQMLDARAFRTRFENLRFEQNFVFRYTDTDGVSGQRQVVIIPSEDAPPKIRELAPDDIVRKVQGGYMVTVLARIPFKGQVDDDHGLTDVRYAYTITHLETARLNRRAAWPILGGTSLTPAGQGLLPGLMDLAITLKAATQAEKKAEDVPVDRYPLPRFKRRWRIARRTWCCTRTRSESWQEAEGAVSHAAAQLLDQARRMDAARSRSSSARTYRYGRPIPVSR